jgi:hypothetical protein
MMMRQERWWEAVLTSEPKINVRKIDASRPMTDLDDEAQAKIEEMMFNERQKKMGLPQTHEKGEYNGIHYEVFVIASQISTNLNRIT